MIRTRIAGVGGYVPPKVWTNSDLSKLMDTSDEWIRQRTGIEERRWAEVTTVNADLALEASLEAIKNAGITKDQIDMIVYATLSPDHDFPGGACFLQARLGLPGIAALDIRQQCTGFIYGSSIADQFIRTGMYKRVLVVGSEIHSKGLDKTTRGRDVSVLFGDGAGAIVYEACDVKDSKKDGFLYSTHLHADGAFAKELWLPGIGCGFTHDRADIPKYAEEDIYPKMNGKAVFVHAVKRIPESIVEGLQANGLKLDDVDLFVLHQANLRINEMVAKQLGIPENKVYNTIQKFGNTTAATIPLGMSDAIKAGKLKRGMLVASAAFGSGFTWGSMIFRY